MIKRNFQHTFSLLNVDYVKLGPKWNYKNVISPYNRIYYINEGEGELSDSYGTHKLEAGYLYIVPSFTLCDMLCKQNMGQYFVQFFEDSADGNSLFADHRKIMKAEASALDQNIFDRLLEINPGRGINRSDNPRIYEKDVFYKEYQQLNNQQNLSVFMETQGILLQLTSRFLTPQFFKPALKKVIPNKIAETLNYIQVNLHTDLSVAQLALRLNQNADYFSRQFKLYTGTRPVHYINEKRVERAQYLMATSRMTYSEISKQIGFEDLSYFSKTFKRFTGLSPKDYKKQMFSVGL
ncbi:AraC family transcriptional regulator [uncultured Mucilaginibacter sp.]|uniref:helix-turn-helix domain-containing protein n=1 Tax=uncultured Mucilaginibacter sp. TaxID=797541 RepID=UPI0025DA7631|nr:AraC family transcriptional regulator [uncultured Mucilaginibacter sp.]